MFKNIKKFLNKNKYVHYGDSKFIKSKFTNIHNEECVFTKPSGGLWASPLNSDYGWIDWVMDNDFRLNVYNKSRFTFTLNDDARVLRITESSQLKQLPKVQGDTPSIWVCLDFEKLSKDYDAIEVLISKDHQLYYDLYGWDVDSLLVMNPDVVEYDEGREIRGKR